MPSTFIHILEKNETKLIKSLTQKHSRLSGPKTKRGVPFDNANIGITRSQ